METILTLIVGTVAGLLVFKTRLPGAMMIGAMIGVSIFNVFFGLAYMPAAMKLVTQIIAGAFIGVSVTMKDILRLHYLLKPIAILTVGMLLFNILMGFFLWGISDIDLLTAFFCAVPGGMNQTPIIAEEMGANAGYVFLAQLIRMLFGIAIFPSVILRFTQKETHVHQENASPSPRTGHSVQAFLLTAAVATAFGLIGRSIPIPIGTMIFSMAAVIVLQLKWNRAYIPPLTKRVGQMLSGAYIGSTVTGESFLNAKSLILLGAILILGYMFIGFVLGMILHKSCNLSLRSGMLAATPAGTSELALLYSDLGVQDPDLIAMQIVRMIAAVTVFPQVIAGVCAFIA